jgi:hypothetical protein
MKNFDKVNTAGAWFTVGLLVGGLGMALFCSLAGVLW